MIEEKMNFARALVLCFTSVRGIVLELLRLRGRTGFLTRFAGAQQIFLFIRLLFGLCAVSGIQPAPAWR